MTHFHSTFLAAAALGWALVGQATAEEAAVRNLFDGKTLTGWKATNFGGEGEVTVENGTLVLAAGSSLTGVTYADKPELPKSNYEISLEAMRVDGSDFFCGLTFPVKDSHASFIVGGWGGAVVGISSIDGMDASENETATFQSFESNKWYKIRVRVTDAKIECWIDDKQIVDAKIEGRKISTRGEVDPSKPLGLATYETKSAIKNWQLKTLAPAAKP